MEQIFKNGTMAQIDDFFYAWKQGRRHYRCWLSECTPLCRSRTGFCANNLSEYLHHRLLQEELSFCLRQSAFPMWKNCWGGEAKARAWYFAEILRDERKRQKLTQQQLGERIGKKREYISSLEQGQTDMQLSTFMLIANALGLRFSLVVGWPFCHITIYNSAHASRSRCVCAFCFPSCPQIVGGLLIYVKRKSESDKVKP